MKNRPLLVLGVLGALLVLSALCAVQLGPVKATPEILWQLRLPRVALGAIVGMALAAAGVIFQALLRNSLADPYILGTSSGASLGVLLAGLLRWHSPFRLYGMALGCALGSIAVVHRISRANGKTPVQTLILSGVLVSTFLNALVFLGVSLFFKETFSTLFFLMGTLTEGEPWLIRISGVLVFFSLAAAWRMATDLNLMSLGDEPAHHLGLDPERTRRWFFLIASLMVSAAVAVSGMIGFIGLMAPHIMRLLIGPDHRTLLPASALGGAILLVWMDAGARTLAAPVEIPVGILAALAGTPFLIYLLRKKKEEVF